MFSRGNNETFPPATLTVAVISLNTEEISAKCKEKQPSGNHSYVVWEILHEDYTKFLRLQEEELVT